MKNELLKKDYARLIVKKGINVQKNDYIWINAELDQPDFVTLVVEECYKAGAKEVLVRWSHSPVGKLHYKYQTLSTLSHVDPMTLARFKYMAKKMPTMLHLISDDPDGMKGINQQKMTKARMRSYPKIKKYRDLVDGKYKWCIAAVPGLKWAEKVFPSLKGEEAINKLWDMILFTSRVDGNDPVENWNKHNEFLLNQRRKLQDLRLVKLHYTASNGTDFTVALNPDIMWGGGVEVAKGKGEFNPNIPSEEVFTSPIAGKCEGTVVSSKPYCFNGQIIDDFTLTFKEGRVTRVSAKKNESLLQKLVAMDEGAAMLGEVALVPYDSPIRESNVLFYNTLFDENAACHIALGRGFVELVPNSENMTTEDMKKSGINDSMIHEDLMIGTRDLDIVGYDDKGNKYQIFKNGNWAI